MKDQNQNQSVETQEETSSPVQEQNQPKSPSSMKKIFGKKWVFPAAYMAAAAIILSIMWAYQSSDDKNTLDVDDLGLNTLTENPVSDPSNTDALPVTTPAEEMQWPADPTAVEVVMPYYDVNASPEEQTAAMIQMDDSFMPSSGISLAKPDNSVFEVKAAMSGTVTRVDNVPYYGNVVEIEHEDGLATVYSSLADVKVEKGQSITQGDVIAQAGRNELQKDLGYHVHFEILKDGESVNPNEYVKDVSLSESVHNPMDDAADKSEEDAAIEDDTEAEETGASAETGTDASTGTEETDVDANADVDAEEDADAADASTDAEHSDMEDMNGE